MIIKNKELHAALHKLWTKAVGKDDYVKTEWVDLERLILELEKQREVLREPEKQPYQTSGFERR